MLCVLLLGRNDTIWTCKLSGTQIQPGSQIPEHSDILHIYYTKNFFNFQTCKTNLNVLFPMGRCSLITLQHVFEAYSTFILWELRYLCKEGRYSSSYFLCLFFEKVFNHKSSISLLSLIGSHGHWPYVVYYQYTLVAKRGFEPPILFRHWFLRPDCIPFQHLAKYFLFHFLYILYQKNF